MGRGGNFTKKDSLKSVKEALQQFLERGFDWIAWFIITLIILFSLVFF
ncbi:hypothetical protein GCM10028803_02190 [Larkinella knui]|nr:hypothetical protein [Larkinella knui]